MKCLEMMIAMMILKKVPAPQVVRVVDLQVVAQVRVEFAAHHQKKKERFALMFCHEMSLYVLGTMFLQ